MRNMETPSRKQNRLPDYDYSQGGAYFITVCTQERKRILSDIVGDGFPVPKVCGKIAEEMIGRIPEKYPDVSVDQYVIMPDHIHILLRIEPVGEAFRLPEMGIADPTNGTGDPSPTIGNVVGWYKYQTTKQINSVCNTPGARVFQRSYYDHVIRNQQDYNEVWEYIENNPRKWAMTKQGRD